MPGGLKKTNLNAWHVEHGGRMVEFAGWEMPVQYHAGPIQEHHTTRQVAGLFDIDHMGQIDIHGPHSELYLNHLVTYDVRSMKLWDAHYAVFCYPDGTCVDDLFIYKLPEPSQPGQFYFFLAVNASNLDKDYVWLKSHTEGYQVEVNNLSEHTYMLAFQGPEAPGIMDGLTKHDLTEVPRFTSIQSTMLGGVPILLGRTGYTGEDGFELFFPAKDATRVWEAILEAGQSHGVKPVGLAARDSLRFEACMPIYGHEISDSITPVEAGLSFAISFEKDFIGRDILLKQRLEKPSRVAVGFELIDRGVAREHYPVCKDGRVIGWVTSGMYAPTLDKYLGMAVVPREFSTRDTEIEIMVRGKPHKARIVKRPFYIPAYRR